MLRDNSGRRRGCRRCKGSRRNRINLDGHSRMWTAYTLTAMKTQINVTNQRRDDDQFRGFSRSLEPSQSTQLGSIFSSALAFAVVAFATCVMEDTCELILSLRPSGVLTLWIFSSLTSVGTRVLVFDSWDDPLDVMKDIWGISNDFNNTLAHLMQDRHLACLVDRQAVVAKNRCWITYLLCHLQSI